MYYTYIKYNDCETYKTYNLIYKYTDIKNMFDKM